MLLAALSSALVLSTDVCAFGRDAARVSCRRRHRGGDRDGACALMVLQTALPLSLMAAAWAPQRLPMLVAALWSAPVPSTDVKASKRNAAQVSSTLAYMSTVHVHCCSACWPYK